MIRRKIYDPQQYINIFNGRNRYHCAENFFLDLEDRNISYAVIKGEVLSIAAYGRPGYRCSADLDILIDRRDLTTVTDCLLEQGYLPKKGEITKSAERTAKIFYLSCSHQIQTFTKTVHGLTVEVDINFDIFWGEYEGRRISIRDFLSDTVELEIYRTKVRALPLIKAFVQLALHHYKDMNSIYIMYQRCIPYALQFQDLYYLLINNADSINPDELTCLAHTYSITPFLYFIFFYMYLVYSDTALISYCDQMKSPQGEYLLNCYGLNNKERKKWKYSFEQRLYNDSLLSYIRDDLTTEDYKKIEFNKKYF